MLLRNARQLEGHALHAQDGVIGEVKDFYFDDQDWHIRYCVVETGKWLQSRRVLISPVVLGDYDAALQVFPVDLTMEQVRTSPDVGSTKPPSRQHEDELRQHYGWPGYWDGVFGAGGLAAPIMISESTANPADRNLTDGNAPLKKRGDPFLRSVNDTIGYYIEASDGSIGHAEDVLIDAEQWHIRYLVVDTRNWWPGRKVIVAPNWILDVNWENSRVVVDLTRDKIRNSPPYEPTMPWNEDYAAALHEYYGRSRVVRSERTKNTR
jgi:hypothetical protein